MILGPTEHRVARYLADRTRNGRVLIRTVDLARELRLERSEAYRITARLRELGIFGIENDKSGARGGRRYWRTAIPHDGGLGGLDPERHRSAWARLIGWARARARNPLRRAPEDATPRAAATAPARHPPDLAGAGTFASMVWGPTGPPSWWLELAPARVRR